MVRIAQQNALATAEAARGEANATRLRAEGYELVTLGELTAGILLLLGLLTRFGAIIGMILNLNYMLMRAPLANGGSIDRLFFLAELIFLLAAAGLVWGLDGQLRQQLSGNAVTRWLAGLNGSSTSEERPVRATA